MLFNSYIDQFLKYQEEYACNSPGELAQKRMALRNHLGPAFEGRTLDAINLTAINYYCYTKRQKLSPHTVNNHLTILSRMLRQAHEDGYLESVPRVKRVRRHDVDRDNYLDASQTHALLTAADLHRNPIWRPAMLLAMHTGMRIGEIMALQWQSVDTEKATITVKASYCRESKQYKTTKNGKVRHLAINDSARAALHGLRALRQGDAAYVLPYGYETAREAINATAGRAGLEKCTWHTLRHTFASNLVMRGVPLHSVSKIMGHSSQAMTERYSHLNLDAARIVMSVLDEK